MPDQQLDDAARDLILDDALATKQSSPDSLQQISQLVAEYSDNDAEIARLEKLLKDLKARQLQLLQDRLPAAMDAAGQQAGLTVSSGHTVSVKPYVSLSVPAASTILKEKDKERRQELLERRSKCLAWLVTNGHGGLIKTEITVPFGKGEGSKAKELLEELRTRGFTDAEGNSDINTQSLTAWARELVKGGRQAEIPAEFNLFVGRVADIKAPKKVA